MQTPCEPQSTEQISRCKTEEAGQERKADRREWGEELISSASSSALTCDSEEQNP